MKGGGICGCRGLVNGNRRSKENLAPHGKDMMLGGRTSQLGMLPGAGRSNENSRLVQLRRWAIIVIMLFVIVQSLLWESLHKMPHTALHITAWWAFILNPLFTYCMIENLSYTASCGVRTGLRLGCWVVYPVVLMYSPIAAYDGFSPSLMMRVIFGSVDGMVTVVEVPAADIYIMVMSLCSVGALAGGLLSYLLAKLVSGKSSSGS